MVPILILPSVRHEAPVEFTAAAQQPPEEADTRLPPDSNGIEVSVASPEDSVQPEPEKAVTREATTENIESLGSQLYEGNKVQAWAEEVNDGSNQSTWSTGKASPNEVQLNGTNSSSPDEPTQPLTADPDHDTNSHSGEILALNGDVADRTSGITDPQPLDADSEDHSVNETTLPTISEHLLKLATTKIWADWMIMVNTSSSDQPIAIYAHSLVLVRSPRLENLMQTDRRPAFGSNVINLYPPREVIPHALDAALRFLYSDSVISEDFPFPKEVTPSDGQARANCLNYILSYWIAAIEFGLPPVAVRAAQLLESFIGWDMAELIMKEAEEISLTMTQTGEMRANIESDYLAVANKLRQVVLRFLSRQFSSQGFRIVPSSTSAASLMRSRFALLEDARLKHNPALASMVFGSMPSSADLSPSSPQSEILPIVSSVEDQVATNILLNLHFADLDFFSKHLQQAPGPESAKLIGNVVSERESRRLKVLSNRTIPNKQRIATSEIWDVAAYREYVQDGHVRRERVGFLLPTKTK